MNIKFKKNSCFQIIHYLKVRRHFFPSTFSWFLKIEKPWDCKEETGKKFCHSNYTVLFILMRKHILKKSAYWLLSIHKHIIKSYHWLPYVISQFYEKYHNKFIQNEFSPVHGGPWKNGIWLLFITSLYLSANVYTS